MSGPGLRANGRRTAGAARLETQAHVLPSPANSAINGQSVAIEPDSSATRSLVASFAGLGLTVTATYAADPSVATRIVHSVERAAGVSG